MKFKNIKVLNDVVLDYSNPYKMFKLAREYDKLKQGAAAFGWYLRAADFADPNEDKLLQYKAIILGAHIFARSEARTQTVKGLVKMAMTTMPERPEAYYFAAMWSIDQNNFRNALMYSQMGLACEEFDLIEEFDYPGRVGLEYCYAVSKWKSDGRDDSKNLFFDLKHKNKLNTPQWIMDSVNGWINNVGYPSTLPYTKKEQSKYRFSFNGLDTIDKNYSRHFQDMFVLSLTNGKKNGSFIEVGSGHPTLFNNTYLLEEKFDWKGLSIDKSERMCSKFSRERKTNIVMSDATQIDFKQLFKQNCIEQHVDFLRINSDDSSYIVLENIPFNKYEFSIIQFQHNACWWGNELRDASRKKLQEIGYILFVPDVSISENQPYEDWWVHPGFANSEMKSNKLNNFAWDYMMRERT